MLSTTLIERTLSLTGKTMDDMTEQQIYCMDDVLAYASGYARTFSIEKFCYYLLSTEFIEKYLDTIGWEHDGDYCDDEDPKGYLASKIGTRIRLYQLGNEEHLVKLLSKI